MKQLVDVKNEGLEALLGKRITLFCMNYIYTGDLDVVVGVVPAQNTGIRRIAIRPGVSSRLRQEMI